MAYKYRLIIKNRANNLTSYPPASVYAETLKVTVVDPNNNPLISLVELTKTGQISISGSGNTPAFDITVTVRPSLDADIPAYPNQTTTVISVSGLTDNATMDLGTRYVGCHRNLRKVLLKSTNESSLPTGFTPDDWFSIVYKPIASSQYIPVPTAYQRQYATDVKRIELDVDYTGGTLYVVPNAPFESIIKYSLTTIDELVCSDMVSVQPIAVTDTDIDDLTYDICGFVFPEQMDIPALRVDLAFYTQTLGTTTTQLYRTYADIATVVGDSIGFFFNRNIDTGQNKLVTDASKAIVTSNDGSCFDLSVSIATLLTRYTSHATHTGAHYFSSCINGSIIAGDYLSPVVSTETGTLTPNDCSIESIVVQLTGRGEVITKQVTNPSTFTVPYAVGYACSGTITIDAGASAYWCYPSKTFNWGTITGPVTAAMGYNACQFEFTLAYPPGSVSVKPDGDVAFSLSSNTPTVKVYPSDTNITKSFQFTSDGYAPVTKSLTAVSSNLKSVRTAHTIQMSGTSATYKIQFYSKFSGSTVTDIPIYGGLLSPSSYVGETDCSIDVLANNNFYWTATPDMGYSTYPVCHDRGMVTGSPQNTTVQIVAQLFEEGKVGLTCGVDGAAISIIDLTSNIEKSTGLYTSSSEEIFIYPATYFGTGRSYYSDPPVVYEIKVTHPEKNDFVTTVSVKPNTTQHVTVTFLSGSGNVTFIVSKSTSPDFTSDRAATIYIDGESYAANASTGICSISNLATGGHSYQITSGPATFPSVGQVEFETVEGTLVVEKGKSQNIPVTLKYTGYVKFINSLGMTVTASLNGESLGSTFPMYKLNIISGSYGWTYLSSGKQVGSGTVTIEPGVRSVVDPGASGVKVILTLPFSEDFNVTGTANIFIDGELKGSTDATGVGTVTGLSSGVHTYKIEKPPLQFGEYGQVMFYSKSGTFTAELGKIVQITDTLEYLGYVKVVTKPQSGYYITFNKSQTDKRTPWYILNVDPGEWSYSLHTQDEYKYVLYTGSVKVSRNAKSLVDVETPSSPVLPFGKFLLKSVPGDAKVSLDPVHNNGIATLIGSTPSEYQAGYGTVYFLFQKDGYRDQVVSGTRLVNADTSVTCSFEASYGTLQVTSEPSGAEVYIDGIKKGLTPYTSNSVPTGSRKIVLKRMNYANTSDTVRIEYQQTVTKTYVMKLQDPRRGNIQTSDTMMF